MQNSRAEARYFGRRAGAPQVRVPVSIAAGVEVDRILELPGEIELAVTAFATSSCPPGRGRCARGQAVRRS